MKISKATDQEFYDIVKLLDGSREMTVITTLKTGEEKTIENCRMNLSHFNLSGCLVKLEIYLANKHEEATLNQSYLVTPDLANHLNDEFHGVTKMVSEELINSVDKYLRKKKLALL